MTKVRVTKQFNFEAAHALWNYDGKCKNIHGHTYKLFVTVIGKPINNNKDPKHGMVIDFGDLKLKAISPKDLTRRYKLASENEKVAAYSKKKIKDYKKKYEKLKAHKP